MVVVVVITVIVEAVAVAVVATVGGGGVTDAVPHFVPMVQSWVKCTEIHSALF